MKLTKLLISVFVLGSFLSISGYSDNHLDQKLEENSVAAVVAPDPIPGQPKKLPPGSLPPPPLPSVPGGPKQLPKPPPPPPPPPPAPLPKLPIRR